MNGEAEELTGWMLSEVSLKSLKTVFNIINEQTRMEAENPTDRVLKEGIVVGLANHTILVRRDGSELPLDDSGAPIKNERGNITGVVVVFHDITERKKIEEATAKQAELINLSPDAIIVRKIDGTITFWSEGAERLYGFSKDEAIGQNINKLLNTEFPMSLGDIQKRLEKEGKWSGEIVHFCKDGSKLYVQSYWLGKFGSDGKIYEMLESNVDISRIEMQFKLESAVGLRILKSNGNLAIKTAQLKI
jgi:PAS domain S-box-containing protein